MTAEYELQRAETGDEWDAFVEASPHGTVYATTAFVDTMHAEPLLFYCVEHGNRKAAVVLGKQAGDEGAGRPDQMIYNGVLCAGAHAPRNPSDAYGALEYFRATEFIVGELARRYQRIEMQLAPSFVDIRPFLWHNYRSGGPRFTVDVRYTSYLDISDCSDDEHGAWLRLRRDRRRDLRNAHRLGITTRELFDPDLCTDLHRQTMERQEIDVPSDSLVEMTALMRSLHDRGRGRMFVAYTADGRPASALFFGIDGKRAYAMFGGTDPTARSLPLFVAVLWEGCRALNRAGIREVDLEGVNSPRRGWFKLSLGGSILPYYSLVLDQRSGAAHG